MTDKLDRSGSRQDFRNPTAIITAENLTMKFRGCEALRGVDLNIEPGTVFALLGENGAGKTTLIRILTGFQQPTGGKCHVGGIDPTTDPLGVRRQIGYVSDSPAMYDWMSVDEIGGFTAAFYNPAFRKSFHELMQRFEIRTDQKIRSLSKGQRAKVALSLAIAHDPPLLILDEPTSGLDPKVRRNFLESMIDRAATGRTVFLSSHQIAEVERVADTIGILHGGRIVLSGSLAELRAAFTRLTIDVDDSLRAIPLLPEPASVISEIQIGSGHQWIVRDCQPEMIASLKNSPGVIDVVAHAATLEEIFVACTDRDATSTAEVTAP